ncbi:NFX1-type zinc finger-containing protein 1 [Fusarium oxysporum f. sp. albedinis]|nr:NFX1-type zinc finger-containing protein 1 [Fusarium oxysporum f. sp. albedinis]
MLLLRLRRVGFTNLLRKHITLSCPSWGLKLRIFFSLLEIGLTKKGVFDEARGVTAYIQPFSHRIGGLELHGL